MQSPTASWLGELFGNEFADVQDWPQLVLLLSRVGLAMALGAALGFEREARGKAAGLRTHMLVAMGSALFVVTAEQANITGDGMSQVIQGLVAGLGFLCAGTILKQQESSVKGLTTAAGLWATAAIGTACGLGQQLTAMLSTVLVLVVMRLIPRKWAGDDATHSSGTAQTPGSGARGSAERAAEPAGQGTSEGEVL